MESETRTQTADAQSLDTVFALLRDRRRRYLVSSLSGRESPASLTELATAVAASEDDAERDEVATERIEAVAAALHHNHLPKLADAGFIAYDAETKTVTPTRVGDLSPFVEVSDGR